MEKSMKQKFLIKATDIEWNGDKLTALDVPEEMIKAMKLANNELLEAAVDENGNVTITKTGSIFND